MELLSAREQYRKFIAAMSHQGWSDVDVKEYSESIGILMGNDDKKALALFPAGTYATAEDARTDARKFWLSPHCAKAVQPCLFDALESA